MGCQAGAVRFDMPKEPEPPNDDTSIATSVRPPASRALAEVRQLLRQYGVPAERAESMDPDIAIDLLFRHDDRLNDRELDKELVAAGEVTVAELRSLSEDELSIRRSAHVVTSIYRRRASRVNTATPAPPPPRDDAWLRRSEILPLLGDMLGVIAEQAAQVEALRAEVQRVAGAQMAVFGKQAILEQLTELADTHDLDGFEAHVEITEDATTAESGETSSDGSSASHLQDARNLHVKVRGLATHLAGLDTGRTVNLETMHRDVAKFAESYKSATRTGTRGKVDLKIDKVRRSKR